MLLGKSSGVKIDMETESCKIVSESVSIDPLESERFIDLYINLILIQSMLAGKLERKTKSDKAIKP